MKPNPIDLGAIRAERFWGQVDVGPPAACWEWAAYRLPRGYGQFHIRRAPVLAHRVAFALNAGRDPGPNMVLHTCDNPPCCNPAHLYEGTQADNLRDAYRRGRWNNGHADKTHCIHGHPFDAHNTYVAADGSRKCRACLARRKRTKKEEV